MHAHIRNFSLINEILNSMCICGYHKKFLLYIFNNAKNDNFYLYDDISDLVVYSKLFQRALSSCLKIFLNELSINRYCSYYFRFLAIFIFCLIFTMEISIIRSICEILLLKFLSVFFYLYSYKND